MNEVVVEIDNILVQASMNATMDNGIKPPMHNLAQKPQTLNLINKGM
jgi:hypothetical protein